MGEEIASRGERARTGSLNGEVSKLSTGIIRGSQEGELTKKLVDFAVYAPKSSTAKMTSRAEGTSV